MTVDVSVKRFPLPALTLLAAVSAGVPICAQDCSSAPISRNRESVVYIEAKRTIKNTGAVETLRATGFIVSEDGYVFTSRVLLGDESDTDDLKFSGSLRSRVAPPNSLQYINKSPLGDVLVLKFTNTSLKWEHVELGEPFEIEIGHNMCSMGFPLDIEYLLRPGVVNSKGGPGGWWYSSIPFDKGEDGAPAFDAMNGKLLGTVRGPDQAGVQGVTYVVPINLTNALLDAYAGISVKRATARSLASAFPLNGGTANAKNNPTPATETKAQLEDRGNSILSVLWPSPQVYVCWENPSPELQHEMSVVRQEVRETWEHESQLRFLGWQKCAAESRGIRIKIEDSAPHTLGLGRQLDGKQSGMVLNLTFENWSASCRTRRDYCIKAIAGHTFGHAIGLGHEQNRPDAPEGCKQLAQGENRPVLPIPYDPESIMNYCNPKFNNDGNLSAPDIAVIRMLYGAPATSSAKN